MRINIVVLLFAIGVLTSPAAILLNESFDYTNGALVVVSGGKWIHTSGTVTGEVKVVAGALVSLSSTNTEDVVAQLAGQPYPAGGGTNVFYASFTLRLSALPTSGGAYFAHLDGSQFRSRVWALLGGATSGKFRIGLSSTSSSVNVTNTTDLSTNTDYLVVLCLTNSTGVARLWINPTAESDPSISTAEAMSGSTVTSFAMRQNTGHGSLTIDTLLVATSFFEVVANSAPVTPTINSQPQGQSVIEGGTATFAVTATGLPAPAYQWQFASTNLPGATNAMLTLAGVATAQAGDYQVIITNAAGSVTSALATLTVIVPNTNGTLSLVHYNVKGNFASDWSTNAAQVQAIARQLQFLNPDIILLNEIPNGLKYEMTNWMTAFFPTYTLAISLGTDGVLRSGVISRFPITRSQSWFENASLTNFGYNGVFTRDLFEAEITVPGATEPLHVFTTHLKSGSDPVSQDRRAAECSVISNFFATVFIPTNGYRPYLLTGDLNEDIDIPMSHSNQPMQRLTSAPTGLQLTTPVNPYSGARVTHSIQGSLDARFDYIMPAGVLASNIVISQVFRTDLLPSPPPPLMTNDDIVASDHLPVQMIFNYPDPQLTVMMTASNLAVQVSWPALIGRRFNVEVSTNLWQWSVAASNIMALSGHPTWTSSPTNSARFYRVVRLP